VIVKSSSVGIIRTRSCAGDTARLGIERDISKRFPSFAEVLKQQPFWFRSGLRV
jgi:hypothetical protein